MSNKVEVKELLEAGVHFGHMTRKWDPNMAPYIYMERNGIHIINLYKTAAKIEEANDALKKIAASFGACSFGSQNIPKTGFYVDRGSLFCCSPQL